MENTAGSKKTKFYSRVEVIGEGGREYVCYALMEASEQDGGRTLKLFKRDTEVFK